MNFSELYQAVINEYERTKSVDKTADYLGVSNVKVRRILITQGLWQSEVSKKVGKLHALGFSTDQIADQLGVGVKNVQAYIPYSKGEYGEFETENSKKCSSYRNRKQAALDAQTENKSLPMASHEVKESKIASHKPFNISQDSPQLSIGKSIPFIPQKETTLTLNLELVELDENGEVIPLINGLSSNDCIDLMYLGKAKNGFSRTVIVPSNMTLQSLHYLIQRAFGFLNSGIHYYSLTQNDCNILTEDNFGKWYSLQGSIFRFPNGAPDRFFDDDYDGKYSINTWYKTKYQKPYINKCASDSYIFQNWLLKNQKQEIAKELQCSVKSLRDEMISSIEHSVYNALPLNTLIEKLTLGELFEPKKELDAKQFRSEIKGSIKHAKEKLSELSKDDSKRLLNTVKQYISYYSDLLHPINESEKEVLKEHIHDLEGIIWPALDYTNPQIEPFTDRLIYRYNSKWSILITCIGKSDEVIDNPKCIYADGLNLIDQDGGIKGYIDILRNIYGDISSKEATSQKELAREKGFTGRRHKPENII